MTKPRLRYRANGTFDVLTHDGYVPLVSVSGFARPFLPAVPASLPSHDERKVLIGCCKPLAAFSSNFSRYSQNLARGFGHEPLSQISHVSLSHDGHPATLKFSR